MISEWRGSFTNPEINELHAEAFETRVFDDWDWLSQVHEHSLGWVTVRSEGHLIGFLNVVWDGLVHAWLQDVMVTQSAKRRGIGINMVNIAKTHVEAAGCEHLHVDFDDDLAEFYIKACGFTPVSAGLISF